MVPFLKYPSTFLKYNFSQNVATARVGFPILYSLQSFRMEQANKSNFILYHQLLNVILLNTSGNMSIK